MKVAAGYSSGNGGDIKIGIQGNLATGGTIPNVPDGRWIGGTHTFMAAGTDGTDAGQLQTLSSPAAVEAGKALPRRLPERARGRSEQQPLRECILGGLEPDPAPLLGVRTWTSPSSGGRTEPHGASGQQASPQVDIAYQDGYHQGNPYLGEGSSTGSGSSWSTGLVDTANKMRQLFTPPETIVATTFYLRAGRISGTGAMSVRFETSAGVEIETITIPAADFVDEAGSIFKHRLVSKALALPRTFTGGSTYRIVLSAPAGTQYRIFPVKDGSVVFGYHPSIAVNGRLEYSLNGGSSWTGFKAGGRDNRSDYDLQFAFLLQRRELLAGERIRRVRDAGRLRSRLGEANPSAFPGRLRRGPGGRDRARHHQA